MNKPILPNALMKEDEVPDGYLEGLPSGYCLTPLLKKTKEGRQLMKELREADSTLRNECPENSS